MLMHDFSSPSDLGTRFFENPCRRRLAPSVADFQQVLNGAEAVSGRSQAFGELMA